jgi:hypothetical protein
MNTNLETRIRDFLREQKTGMFYNDDGSEIEPIDFDNFNNISIFLDTAVSLLEETIGEK